ncbi:Exosome complex component RRP4 [Tyrophagus putrescentiae]|nr:Exosome complex component RRP4 [Tyrophagus putrescentiae]
MTTTLNTSSSHHGHQGHHHHQNQQPNIELFSFEEVKAQLDPIVIENERQQRVKYVLPGDTITIDGSFMRGHGTYHDEFVEEQDQDEDEEDLKGASNQLEKKLIASLAGVVEPINRLISVRPLRTRYNGAIGDVVVGRITEVQQKRWRVETNARLLSILQLSSVNLPGGELRRKTTEDELLMRQYLAEGDLICAEVQTLFEDGALGLSGQGTLVQVSPSMIAKRKIHCHSLPCGVYIALGNNGAVYLTTTACAEANQGGFVIDAGRDRAEERERVARVRNVVLALADNKIALDYGAVVAAYEIAFEKLEFEARDLLRPPVARMVADQTRIHLLSANLITV